MFQRALIIAPFWQQYKMSITHTACCVGTWIFERHTVWLKAGFILLAIAGRTATFPRKECRMCFPFCRDTLSWKKPCLSSKENCSLWMMDETSILTCKCSAKDMRLTARFQDKKTVPKQNCEKNLMHFWCSFDAVFKTASKQHQNCIRFFRIFSDVL